ncbi:hypothetical protein BH23CHL2_BH23CHL2_01630 [soil metagenome]
MVASSNQPANPQTKLRHGEVIETSTIGFLAESDRLHRLPQLGELVRAAINDNSVAFAVVSFGETSAIDSGRRAVRRGSPDGNDRDVYDRHPELDHVLRTVFRAAAVGYESNGGIRHSLPPLPVPLHFGVQPCTPDEVRRFCSRPDYLSSLLAFHGDVGSEQLVAAHLRWADEALDDGHAWLRDACRLLARLMRQDYDRLVLILETVDPDR